MTNDITPTPDYAAIAAGYVDCFNRTDRGERRSAIEQRFADGCRYVDPNVDVAGHDGVDGFIAATQDQFAGYTFTVPDPVDGHHRQLRCRWHAGPEGDPSQFVGFDVLVLGADDRIEAVYGFMDRVPAA